MTPTVAIIGAGPAGLWAAEAAAEAGCAVTVYDQTARPGRKFLLAGRGGLNLTNAAALEPFLSAYPEPAYALRRLIRAHPPEALRSWADGLGAETFVGSSGRVFPKAMKASPLLRAWLRRLEQMGVRFEPRARLIRLEPAGAVVVQHGQERRLAVDATVLALGGASWPELGSDGAWVDILTEAGVGVAPLVASNAGVLVDWWPAVSDLFGQPLKNIQVIAGAGASQTGKGGLEATRIRRAKGEVILSARGLEGGPIYAVNPAVRELAARFGWPVLIHIDLKPSISLHEAKERFAKRNPKRSLGPWLMSAMGLSRPAARLISTVPYRHPDWGPWLVNEFPVHVRGFYPIERAISTAGGAQWGPWGNDLTIPARPGVFLAGEMLDWDAPTGGYLLQACFATGRAAGLSAATYAKEKGGGPEGLPP